MVTWSDPVSNRTILGHIPYLNIPCYGTEQIGKENGADRSSKKNCIDTMYPEAVLPNVLHVTD